METMMRGFDLLLDGEERTGAVLEVSIDKVYFRDPVGYVDESMRWLVEDSAEFFARAFGQSA
jgi:hypothetical protein